jgi:feruloyl esterase
MVRRMLFAAAFAALMVSAEILTTRAGAALANSSVDINATDATGCANLIKLTLRDTMIGNARVVRAAGDVPEYCRVEGAIEKKILFEVDLPTTTWNGKFFYAGGGGFNGSIPALTYGVKRGYASAGSDTGHQGDAADASWALDNPKAQINYAHRATHLVTAAAKEIVRAFYRQKEARAYWLGCSNGGKMGLMEVQRYPEDFDGLVIGNFVIDRTRLMAAYTWNAQALAAGPIPQYKIPAIERATLAACDAQDGLKDGLIDRPDRCKFDPKVLTCKGADGPDCLTSAQVAAYEKILAGPRDSAGTLLFPGFVPGHEDDYAPYITGIGAMHAYPASTWRLQDGFWRYFVFGPKYDPITQFNFDTTLRDPRVTAAAADQDSASADLSAFKRRGGKLIMYHGWADHSISPLRTVRYFDDIHRTMGPQADEFLRLFIVPGLHHCVGGPGLTAFGGRGQAWLKDDPAHDIVRALDRWVEQNVAPEKIIGATLKNNDAKQGVVRTRPLCTYPQTARYVGSGNVDDAANFVCAR